MAILPAGAPGYPGGVELRLRQPPGRLQIDGTPFRASIGLQDTSAFVKAAAAAGHQTQLDYIARCVAEGDALMRIENKSDPVVQMGKDFLDRQGSELALTTTRPPNIQYTEQRPDLQWVLTSAASPTGRLIDRMA